MRAARLNTDDMVDLEYNEHHFHIPMTAASYTKHVDGTDNSAFLQTPMMHCTDAGCTFTAQSTVPLAGGPETQLVHAYYLVAIGVASTLPLAQEEVGKRFRSAKAARP